MEQLSLFVKEIEEEKAQENFRRIGRFVNDLPLIKGAFEFFEIDVPSAVSNLRFRHNLGFLPKDVITTSVKPGSTGVVWNYELFTKEFVDLSAAGAAKIRFFLGSYDEGI